MNKEGDIEAENVSQGATGKRNGNRHHVRVNGQQEDVWGELSSHKAALEQDDVDGECSKGSPQGNTVSPAKHVKIETYLYLVSSLVFPDVRMDDDKDGLEIHCASSKSAQTPSRWTVLNRETQK